MLDSLLRESVECDLERKFKAVYLHFRDGRKGGVLWKSSSCLRLVTVLLQRNNRVSR